MSKEFFQGFNVFKLKTDNGNILRRVVKNELTKFEKHILILKIKIKNILKNNQYSEAINLSNDCFIYTQKYKHLPRDEFINKVWQEFFIYKNMINAPIKYDVTSTIHKAQGSTYHDVIIYTKDMYWLSQNDSVLYNKLLYTAITRAKYRIFICNFFDEPEYIKTKIEDCHLFFINIHYILNLEF